MVLALFVGALLLGGTVGCSGDKDKDAKKDAKDAKKESK
jgi:hypothetical protein